MIWLAFNPVRLDALFRLPLLQSKAHQLEKLRNNLDELVNAGLTPMDIDESLKQTRQKITALAAKSQQFQQRYGGKICSQAFKGP